MAQQILSTNTFTTAKWIVSSTSSDGTHTTIASALTSASSGDTIFIRPGTYTENLTLKAGVNLAAYSSDSLDPLVSGTPNVTISGTLTATFSGTCAITGINLQTNSATVLTVSGANSTNVYLKDCFINATNNNAISITSSGGSNVNLFQCNGNLGTTAIHFFDVSGATAQLFIYEGVYNNSGTSLSVSTVSSSAKLFMRNIEIYNAFTTSNTSAINVQGCYIRPPSNIGLTINGTGTNIFTNCAIETGTASGISIGSGATCIITESTFQSSNTNVITGLGTITITDLEFYGSSSGINTTTVSYNSNNIKTTTYTAGSTTWTKDPRTQYITVMGWGPGGGGGSGRKGVTTTSSGGSGGSQGGSFFYVGPSSVFGSTETIVVGTGGTGGLAQASDGVNGNPGNAGSANTQFGSNMLALAGSGGNGGSTTAVTGGLGKVGVAFYPGYAGVNGGNGNVTAGGSVSSSSGGSTIGTILSTSAGGGGGADSITQRAGGTGGGFVRADATSFLAGGTGGLESTGIAGGNGNPALTSGGIITGGTGGGGGGGYSVGANGATTGGKGGNGGNPGGGGGGGGGGLSTTANSGAGGDGADGKIIVIEYF